MVTGRQGGGRRVREKTGDILVKKKTNHIKTNRPISKPSVNRTHHTQPKLHKKRYMGALVTEGRREGWGGDRKEEERG
jgi:hypothetical protein